MAKYKSKFVGLTIIITPEKRPIINGKMHIKPGKRVKFVDGVYHTEDQETINFLDVYAKNHPDTISRVDKAEEVLKNVHDVLKKATEETKKEVEKDELVVLNTPKKRKRKKKK